VTGLFRTVDCVRIPVPDLDTGLAYYSGRLGHTLIWRTATAAGLRLPGGDSELVLHTEGDEPETDLLVESVDEAVAAVVAAGGSVRVRAMDIPVGRVAVVADPFGNALTIVDLSKGRYRTDADGKVTGVG
jgi:predicted enzyme related to lactoylglutathione lyase